MYLHAAEMMVLVAKVFPLSPLEISFSFVYYYYYITLRVLTGYSSLKNEQDFGAYFSRLLNLNLISYRMHGFRGELLLPGVGEGGVLDPKATLARVNRAVRCQRRVVPLPFCCYPSVTKHP